MRNMRFVFTIVVLFLFPVMGQAYWTWLNPKPTGNSLSGVWSIDDTTAYAAGDGALIMKTTNSGISWTFQNTGTIASFASIQFPGNGMTGYALGDYYRGWPMNSYFGVIMKTDDGGVTWVNQTDTRWYVFSAIHFPIDGTTGYAVGQSSLIMKTSNEGATWATLMHGTLPNDFYAVYFTARDTGFVAGSNGGIYKTTNGGATWDTLTSGTTQTLRSVFFPTAMIGYAVGDSGCILRTTNEGANWASQTSGTIKSLNSV